MMTNIRKAELKDIDAVERIYNDIHTAEERGAQTIGWIRGVYPVRKTAEDALDRGNLFVQEDQGQIVGAGIINQTQVDVYALGECASHISHFSEGIRERIWQGIYCIL